MQLDPLALGIALLAVGGLSALALGFVNMSRRGEKLAQRLSEPVPQEPTLVHRLQPPEKKASLIAKILEPLAIFAKPTRKEELERLRNRLNEGGIRREGAVATFLATKVALAVIFLGAALYLNAQRADRIQPGMLVAIVACAVGFYLPDWWLRSRIQTRQTAIERGLPDALDLLVTCVEAGLGLDASLQRVADEVKLAWPILASELETTYLEVKAGIPRVEAFRRLAARTGVADLKSLSATLTQTEIFGTSVALALRIQAEGIRVRRMQRAEEKAAYVSVKMTIPLIVCILPTLFSIVLGPAVINMIETLFPTMGGGR